MGVGVVRPQAAVLDTRNTMESILFNELCEIYLFSYMLHIRQVILLCRWLEAFYSPGAALWSWLLQRAAHY